MGSAETILRSHLYDKYLLDERVFSPFRDTLHTLFGEPLPEYLAYRRVKCEGQGRLLGAMFAPMVADSFSIRRFSARRALLHGALLGRAWRVFTDDALDQDTPCSPSPEIASRQDFLLAETRRVLMDLVPEEWQSVYGWKFDELAHITLFADKVEQKLRKTSLDDIDAEALPDAMGLKIALTGWIPDAALHYARLPDADLMLQNLHPFMTALNAAIQLNHDLLDVAEDWHHKHVTYPTLLAARRFGVELGTGDVYPFAYHPDVLKPVLSRLRHYMALCLVNGTGVFPTGPLVAHCRVMSQRYDHLKASRTASVQEIRGALAANQGHPTENQIRV